MIINFNISRFEVFRIVHLVVVVIFLRSQMPGLCIQNEENLRRLVASFKYPLLIRVHYLDTLMHQMSSPFSWLNGTTNTFHSCYTVDSDYLFYSFLPFRRNCSLQIIIFTFFAWSRTWKTWSTSMVLDIWWCFFLIQQWYRITIV